MTFENKKLLSVKIDRIIYDMAKDYCYRMNLRPADLVSALLIDELTKDFADRQAKEEIKKKIKAFILKDMME